MATVYLTEYSGISVLSNHKVTIGSSQAINAYNSITLSGSTSLSSQLNAATTLLKITSDTNCWLAYGPTNSVTASVGDDYIVAGIPYYVPVQGGSYVAGIT